jgi:hypothetical protein
LETDQRAHRDLELRFFEGSTAYDIARADMTPEQLEILDKLCEIAPPPGPLGADYTSYQVTVTDRSGESATYRAVEQNIRDSDESGVDGDRTLDIDSLAPFLRTYQCASAKAMGPYDLESGSLWNGTPVLTGDPGCSNGVFVGCGSSSSRPRPACPGAAATSRCASLRSSSEPTLRIACCTAWL